jgi:uridine phosphorylase
MEWYSRDKELFDPEGAAVDLKADSAVMCFTEGFYPRLVKCLGLSDARPAPAFGGCQKGRLGKDLMLFKSDIGAPAAAMAMEVIIASGVKRVLMMGVAGSLSPTCQVGSHVIPTWGIREEGTSYHYLPSRSRPKPSMRWVRELKEGLSDLEPRLGGVWSTDAPFRETPRKIREYAAGGVLAADMETTALMAVAARRKAEFAAVLTISDLMYGERWQPAFGSKALRRARDAVCERVAETVL